MFCCKAGPEHFAEFLALAQEHSLLTLALTLLPPTAPWEQQQQLLASAATHMAGRRHHEGSFSPAIATSTVQSALLTSMYVPLFLMTEAGMLLMRAKLFDRAVAMFAEVNRAYA